MLEKRDVWSSKSTFLLAAIGSAIGLGNIWRFPYVCYANGGGAFLIAYAVCLFVAGIPLLILEFGIGKRMNNAAPGSFMTFRGSLEWFGWFAVGVGFVITTYYSGIMSYCINYFVYSFKCAWGANPERFFFDDVLGMTKGPWEIGKLQIPLLLGLFAAWVWIIASIWQGTKTVGKVVWFTVLGPWLLLIIFVIRGVTLDGAAVGLRYYLTPVWSKLLEPRVWLAAVSQVFFSLTVGFGVMIAYGSFLDEKISIVSNALIIGIADALTAIVGGFAVFGALGHKALADGVPVAQVVSSGPGLTFVTYPEIINGLPLPQLFGLLFFTMLGLLAIDSAFSLVEGISAGLQDKFAWSHKKANLIVGSVGFVLGIPYIFGAGIHWLDIVDHFMNHFGLTLVVLGECLIVGWYFKAKNMRAFVNRQPGTKIGAWWDIAIKFVLPVSIVVMLGFELRDRIRGPYGDFGLRSQEIIFGWAVILVVVIISVAVAKFRGSADYESRVNAIRQHERE